MVESGRDGAAWVMSMAERIKREGCSRRLVKDYGIYGIDSGREGALWLGGLYETMQREGWTRMSIGGGVLQDGVKRLLQKAYEDLAGLMRDLEGLGRACRGEGEKRPAFRVVVEKIEQIELKKGRIKVLELALRRVWLDQEGVQIGVRSGERSCFLFVDANWGVVEEIFSREAELKRIKGEVAKLSFSLVSKYERNLVAWITRPRCGGINKKV